MINKASVNIPLRIQIIPSIKNRKFRIVAIQLIIQSSLQSL